LDELERHFGSYRAVSCLNRPDIAVAVANGIVKLRSELGTNRSARTTAPNLARFDSRIAELKIDVKRSGIAVQAFVQQQALRYKESTEARRADQRLQELEHHDRAT